MSDHIYMELCQPTWMPCNHTLRVTKDLAGSVEGVPCPYCRITELEANLAEVSSKLAELQKERNLFEQELRDIWDYGDEHIAIVLNGEGG